MRRLFEVSLDGEIYSDGEVYVDPELDSMDDPIA